MFAICSKSAQVRALCSRIFGVTKVEGWVSLFFFTETRLVRKVPQNNIWVNFGKFPPFFWAGNSKFIVYFGGFVEPFNPCFRAWVFELLRVAPGPVPSVQLHLYLQFPGAIKSAITKMPFWCIFCYLFFVDISFK